MLRGRGKNARRLKGFSAVFLVLILILNSFLSFSAVDARSIVLDDDIICIKNVDYSILDNDVCHITVTVSSTQDGLVRLLYTNVVNDDTLKQLDSSSEGVQTLYETSRSDNTFIYDIDVTEDIVIAACLFGTGTTYVSAPLAVYLDDFQSNKEAIEFDNKLSFYFRLIVSLLLLILFMLLIKIYV